MWSAVKQARLLADHLAQTTDPLGRLDEFIDMREKAVDEIWAPKYRAVDTNPRAPVVI